MLKRLLVIVLISLPTFALMLRPGVYTMHDFHLFRQFEFDKCIAEGTFPCRWAPDSSLGFGQPMFNFYGQFTYWVGSLFRSLGFSVLNSVKGVFILSLLASAAAMYFLARTYWGDRGGVISALIYMYAPYRAVDVWVRGALPEALGFVFLPLIWLCVDQFILKHKYRYLYWLIVLVAGLIITHNLSALMFAPFVLIWAGYRLFGHFSRAKVEDLVSAGLVILLLPCFYLLPLVFESRFITLDTVVSNYYNFQSHFVSLKQLFWSNFWGYGGSIWGPNDGLSFAVGYIQWLLPLAILALLMIKRKIGQNRDWLVLILLGGLALFLTHGKSLAIWKLIPPLAYVQFPWRFLTLAVFLLSLACGLIAKLIGPKLVGVAVVLGVIWLNVSFFRPDIWLAVGDNEYFSGASWNQQRSSAISDYWPQSAPQPQNFADSYPVFEIGQGAITEINKGAHKASYLVNTVGSYGRVTFPIVYFPGWTVNGQQALTNSLGLVSWRTGEGKSQLDLEFRNTFVRTLGNWVSGLTLIGLIVWGRKYA